MYRDIIWPRLAPAMSEMLAVASENDPSSHRAVLARMAELDVLVREGLTAAGYPGQPSHPIAHGVGARAHEPPYAHRAGGGVIEEGMVLAIEPGAYWLGGGGLRVEDNFLITADGAEKLSSYPDDFR
jgi:Xaa-Pro aminopeptidase